MSMVKVKGKPAGNNAKRANKNEVSIILTDNKQNRDWIDINESRPDAGVPVVIRIMNRGIVFAEDDSTIIYGEDEKVARMLMDVDDPTDIKWVIEPPYTKYDYSPLSTRDKLNDGTEVTHWAYATENEMEWWKSRLNPIGDYTHLGISVSQDYEELVYRALINGASMIARSVNGDLQNEENEIEAAMYAVLTDLQCCIDRDSHIQHGTMIPDNMPLMEDMDDANKWFNELMDHYNNDLPTITRIIRGMAVLSDNKIIEMNNENR